MNKFLLTAAIFTLAGAASANDDFSNEKALIESWLSAQRAYDNVPGMTAAIVDDQDLAWSAAFGYADIEKQQPAATDTIYGICSISKLFTGVAVMQLRDRGKFKLDDPLSDLLPWFDLDQAHQGSPEITLRAVLTHSAGLPRESDYPYWSAPDFEFPSREAIRERLASQQTLYPADRYFQYSNLGLSLAGEVVAEQSGEDFDGYIHKHILAPLGMKDTETGFPTDAREPRIATGYSYPGRDHTLKPMPRYDAKGIAPAAGFASTAPDLARFASWQFRLLDGKEDKVLQGNTLREMQRVQWLDWDWDTARGLAFGVYRSDGRTLTGHSGSCPGFNTRLAMDPLAKVAVILMANRNNVNLGGYTNAILDIIDAGGTSDDEPQADNLEDYTGGYDLHPWGGEELVFRWKDGLAIVSLPTTDPVGSMTLMKHVEGDRFHTVRDDDEQRGHDIEFLRNDDGKVHGLKVHSMYLPKQI
jgi:CubicO group peptidase (beta-lactamase class C family)